MNAFPKMEPVKSCSYFLPVTRIFPFWVYFWILYFIFDCYFGVF